MPVRERAGGRVKIHVDGNGLINKITGKTVSGAGFQTMQTMEDVYGDYGPRQFGEDALGRPNRFALQRDGYMYDVETAEAYGSALIEFAQQQRRRSAQYHETNNTAPILR